MRSIKLLLLLFVPFLFAGCLEINEEISVTKSGGGNYGMKMDMGKLIDMMQSFMPAEELEKADLKQVRDTTIMMKDYIDSNSALTAEQKSLLKGGTIHMNMNVAEKIFKLDLLYPFSSLDNLQKMYSNVSQTASGFSELFKGMNPPGSPEFPGEKPSLNKISSYYDIVTDKSSISRKLNKERYATMANDSMMQQMKSMSAMGAGMLDLKMNMTVSLPSAIKKFTGNKATVSDDKKTLTVRNDMLDIFEHPEYFEFSVQY